MYVGMIETRSLKILLKSFHDNYSDLFKKNNTVGIKCHIITSITSIRQETRVIVSYVRLLLDFEE